MKNLVGSVLAIIILCIGDGEVNDYNAMLFCSKASIALAVAWDVLVELY